MRRDHSRCGLAAEEYIPSPYIGIGTRVEDRAADGADAAVLPYINLNFPATRGTFRLTIEGRIQRGCYATFLELGSIM